MALREAGQDRERHRPDVGGLRYDLPAGSLLRLQRARGWTLHCAAGTLLLTQEGDARDYVLCAGARAFIHTHGRVLVGTAGPGGVAGRIHLTPTSGIRAPWVPWPTRAPCSTWATRHGLLPGAPVARLLRPMAASAEQGTGIRPRQRGAVLPGCADADPGPLACGRVLTYWSVFGEPGLLEELVRRAHRARHRAIGDCAAAAWTCGMLGVRRLSGAALAGMRWFLRRAGDLRPRLPSLEETFAARVFLRSRL